MSKRPMRNDPGFGHTGVPGSHRSGPPLRAEKGNGAAVDFRGGVTKSEGVVWGQVLARLRARTQLGAVAPIRTTGHRSSPASSAASRRRRTPGRPSTPTPIGPRPLAPTTARPGAFDPGRRQNGDLIEAAVETVTEVSPAKPAGDPRLNAAPRAPPDSLASAAKGDRRQPRAARRRHPARSGVHTD